jgi:hypothetical protein
VGEEQFPTLVAPEHFQAEEGLIAASAPELATAFGQNPLGLGQAARWGLGRMEGKNFREPGGFRALLHRRAFNSYLWGFPVLLIAFALCRHANGSRRPVVESNVAQFLHNCGKTHNALAMKLPQN